MTKILQESHIVWLSALLASGWPVNGWGRAVIHRFSIENFRSIRDKQVIDLVLPRTTPDLSRFPRSDADGEVRLPTVVALFGPNASGKTNVLRALAAMIDFAANSFRRDADRRIPFFRPFRAEGWWDRPTRIVVELDAAWPRDKAVRLFRYDLLVEYGSGLSSAERVGHEILSVREKGRFRTVFRRNDNGIKCEPDLGLRQSDPRLEAVRPNASVIATLAALNHPFFEQVQEDVALTERNIPGLTRIPFTTEEALRYLQDEPEARNEFVHELRRLDLGLEDIQIESRPSGIEATFEHEGLDAPVALMEESKGTRHFLAMFPALYFTLRSGRPALIDEFDVGLHSLLTPEILNWFYDPRRNKNKAQLFLAGHNVSLLDYLEKEEVLLIDKRRDGASTVTRLRDFQGLRREPSLARKYLGGVFGAVPNVG